MNPQKSNETHCSQSVTIWLIRPILLDIKKNIYLLRYLGLHASEADSGLGPESDGLLVPRVEDVNQLGVISAGRVVIETCRSAHHVTGHKSRLVSQSKAVSE